MNTSPTIEMMGYTASKPAFAGSPQSAQADLISSIAHDFNRGADVWTRYPCGAGELVEQQKPLDGGSWTTSALHLQGISLVRRNNEWHHFDPLGTAGVITNSSASVISNNLYDLFGVKRYEQGSAETPWRWGWIQEREEGLRVSPNGRFTCSSGCLSLFLVAATAHAKTAHLRGGPYPRSMCESFLKDCSDWAKARFDECQTTQNIRAWCGALGTVCLLLPAPGVKLFCSFVGGGCTIGWIVGELLNRCQAEFTGRLSFCTDRAIFCFRNSYPDKPDNSQNR